MLYMYAHNNAYIIIYPYYICVYIFLPLPPAHLFQGTEVRDRHLEGKIGLLSSTCRKKKNQLLFLLSHQKLIWNGQSWACSQLGYFLLLF